MTESSERQPLTYSPELVQKILRRATEIESSGAIPLTDDELRQIASEVGISERALEAALSQVTSISAGPPVIRRALPQHVWIGVLGVAAGMGATTAASSAVIMLSLETFSLVFALAARGDQRLRTFVVANSALWGGVGIALVTPPVISALTMLSLPFVALVVSTGIGVGAVWLRDQLTGTPDNPRAGTGPRTASAIRQSLHRARRWLKRISNLTEFHAPMPIASTPSDVA